MLCESLDLTKLAIVIWAMGLRMPDTAIIFLLSSILLALYPDGYDCSSIASGTICDFGSHIISSSPYSWSWVTQVVNNSNTYRYIYTLIHMQPELLVHTLLKHIAFTTGTRLLGSKSESLTVPLLHCIHREINTERWHRLGHEVHSDSTG